MHLYTKKQMEFLYLFLYRSISGAQNGYGYARSNMLSVATLLMVFMAMGLILYAGYENTHTGFRIAAGLCGLGAVLSAVMVDQSFRNRGGGKLYDIHLWETITTGAITLGAVLVGGNLLYILASIYPGLILHKGFVNLGAGLLWWDSRTDDPTGDTFSIPSLGIAIPRAATTIRIILAVASLVLAALTFALGWSFQVIT